ncbi:MAG: histidinol dehydrogenase, partial [Candidatus Gallimonas sp.]
MRIYGTGDCGKLLARPFEAHEKELATVREILADVRERGNAAVFDYEKKFDSTDLTEEIFRVSEEEFEEAYRAVSPELLSSLKKAIANVLAYHKR